MSSPDDIVITGLGVVSPVGIGRHAFWEAIAESIEVFEPVPADAEMADEAMTEDASAAPEDAAEEA